MTKFHTTVYYLNFNFFGVSDQATKWIKSFLSNRTQTVMLENHSSDKIPVTSGVPQGTILGSILFLIQIKWTSDCIKLQEDLDGAIKWEQDWLMQFHSDKCNILRVTTKKTHIHFYYNMNGHILESVESAKYFGITISSNLKWNKHIQNMTSKANKTLEFIRSNLKINSVTIKNRAYQALIRPKLEYCCTVCDPYTAENIYSIEKVQRRAASYVCSNYKYTESVTNMINTLHCPTLQERRLKSRLKMFHRITNNKIAIPHTDILIKSKSNTRSSHEQTYRQIRCRKDSYKFSFFSEL